MTSDERRDVAESLRYMNQYERICYKEQFFDELAETVVGFEDYHDFGTVIEKLADLIDPTCESEADVNPVDGFMCSACGWWGNAQQAWSNGWGEPNFDSPTEYAIRFCPNCGARVVRGDGE